VAGEYTSHPRTCEAHTCWPNGGWTKMMAEMENPQCMSYEEDPMAILQLTGGGLNKSRADSSLQEAANCARSSWWLASLSQILYDTATDGDSKRAEEMDPNGKDNRPNGVLPRLTMLAEKLLLKYDDKELQKSDEVVEATLNRKDSQLSVSTLQEAGNRMKELLDERRKDASNKAAIAKQVRELELMGRQRDLLLAAAVDESKLVAEPPEEEEQQYDEQIEVIREVTKDGKTVEVTEYEVRPKMGKSGVLTMECEASLKLGAVTASKHSCASCRHGPAVPALEYWNAMHAWDKKKNKVKGHCACFFPMTICQNCGPCQIDMVHTCVPGTCCPDGKACKHYMPKQSKWQLGHRTPAIAKKLNLDFYGYDWTPLNLPQAGHDIQWAKLDTGTSCSEEGVDPEKCEKGVSYSGMDIREINQAWDFPTTVTKSAT